MATYQNYNSPELTKKEILMTLVCFCLIVFGIYKLVNMGTMNHCNNIYPNPEIGGCGIYSEYDLNKRWCEEKGGRYLSGGFSADNCVFPPKDFPLNLE